MIKKLREIEYIKAWAAFMACTTVCGFIVGVVAGAILGVLYAITGSDTSSLKLWGSIAGFFAGLPVSYAFFRLFVSKMIVSRLADAAETPIHTAESTITAGTPAAEQQSRQP
jgi:hypothetical protein